jgi:hypothetical protein
MLMFSCRVNALSGNPGTPTFPASFSSLFSKEAFSGLNTAGSEFYLSEEEKMLVGLCNLARHDGSAFIREVLIPAGIDTSLPAMKTCILKLSHTRNLHPLMPAYSLHKTAFSHARDMGMKGDSGHVGSDGRNFLQRISEKFPSLGGFAENFHLGSGEATGIVIALLSGTGEKQIYADNILSPNLHYIGVSIQPHRLSCSNTVLDFARKPAQLPAASATDQKRKKTEAYFMDCPKGRNHDQAKKQRFSFFGLFSRGH